MILSWIWTILVFLALTASAILGRGTQLAAATIEGAQSGIALAIAIAGSICLWSGVGNLMDKSGITGLLAKLLRPLLKLIFPGTKADAALSRDLSANICANILGLGNAATPMGIRAAKRMVDANHPGVATDQLCRLIVLNTASIQLIPANVAAIRLAAGCQKPYDILPAVWMTSLCAAGVGLTSAFILGRLWRHD